MMDEMVSRGTVRDGRTAPAIEIEGLVVRYGRKRAVDGLNLKVLVGEVAAGGRTVFFSTHLLSDIEAVADTIGIIKGGRLLVGGDLDDLRATHKTLRLVYTETPPDEEIRALRDLPGVREVERKGRGVRLRTRGDVESLQRTLQSRPWEILDVDSTGMSLEDIFIAYVEEAGSGR